MGGIRRPIQGLRHLQSLTTHYHTRKICRTPNTMLSNQTHVKQKHSQAHNQQGRYNHQLQSRFQKRRQHGPGNIYVLTCGLLWNTRIRVDGPGTKQIPIFAQGQLTNINQAISDPPTGTFSYGMLFDLFCMLYVDNRALFFEYSTNIEKGITLLSDQFSRFGLEMHIGTRKKNSNTECVFSLPPSFFNTKILLLTSLTTFTLYL